MSDSDRPDPAGPLVVFESGSLDAFENAVLQGGPSARGFVLNMQDARGNLPAERFGPDSAIANHLEFAEAWLLKEERLEFLDDAIDAIVSWASRPGRSGRSLRQTLSFRGEVSAWWLLPLAEKDVHGPAAQMFRALWIFDRWLADRPHGAAPFARLVWAGDRRMAEAVKRLLTRRGALRPEPEIEFLDVGETPPSVSRRLVFSSALRTHAKALLTRTASWVLCPALPASERPMPSNTVGPASAQRRTLVISEFPASWQTAKLIDGDRYMGAAAEALSAELGNDAELALWMRLGPARRSRSRTRLDAACAMFQQAGLPRPTILDEENSWGNFALAQTWASRAARRLRSEFARREYGAIVYKGVDLTDDFARWTEEETANVAPLLLEQGLNLTQALRRRGRPLVVFRNEFYAEGRVIAWACRMAGCRSISLQHGNVSRRHGVYRPLRAEYEGPDAAPAPTVFAVWHERIRNALQERLPQSPFRIAVVGALASTLGKNLSSWPSAADARRQLGWDLNAPYWVFAAQGAMTMENCRLLLNAWNALGEKAPALVIKPHPRDGTIEILRALLEQRPHAQRATSFSTESLELLLPAANACITCYSTVGYEALRLARPLLAMRRADERGYGDFNSYSSLARIATNEAEIARVIAEISALDEFQANGSGQADEMEWLGAKAIANFRALVRDLSASTQA